MGDISIGGNVTITTTAHVGAGIGSGRNGDCGDINICSYADVTALTMDSYDGSAAIGSGYHGSCTGTISIFSKAKVDAGNMDYGAEKIGAGEGGSCSGGVKIYPDAEINVTMFSTENESKYFYGYADDSSTITKTVEKIIETTGTVTSEVTVPTTVTVTETTVETTTQTVDTFTTVTETVIVPTTTTIITTSMNNAYFQWGARSNQSTALSINDMHTKSLRGEIPSKSDLERLNAMDSDSAEYASFMDTLTAASNMTLDDISVGTRENANVAICVINGALDYALDVSTTLGAHSKRMEVAALNIITMSENVQASESVIRDSDMATAMTNYAKANVLRQAAQSMLALANQNGSNVLTLLQN